MKPDSTRSVRRGRTLLRRLPRIVIALIGLALLGALVLQVAGWWLVPWLDARPDRVAALLSTQMQRPVRFDAFNANWRREGPLLELRGVEIADPTGRAPALRIARAEFAVHLYAWTRPGSPWSEFRVIGPKLSIERQRDGRWRLRGFDGQKVEGDSNPLFEIGRVSVRDATVAITDVASGSQWSFDRVHALIENDWNGRRFGARARAGNGAFPVRVACRARDDWQTGRCFASGVRVALSDWQPQRSPKVAPWPGAADVSAWFDWEPGKRTLRADVGIRESGQSMRAVSAKSSRDPALGRKGNGPAPGDAMPVRPWRLVWQQSSAADSWQLDLAHVQGQHVRVRRRGSRTDIASARIDVAIWEPLLRLVPSVPAATIGWLDAAQPRGRITDIRVGFDGGSLHYAQARLRGIGWKPHRDRPGVRGLAAVVSGDRDAIVMEPEQNTRTWLVSRDFPEPLALDWKGGVVGWLAGEDSSRLEASALDIALDGSARISGRASLEFRKDRARPFANFALALDVMPVDRLQAYWPRTHMPAHTIDWLQRSLAGGEVRDARLILHGDLADWPFKGRRGRFETHAEVVDTRLTFKPDWPAVEVDSAAVSFVGPGMDIVLHRGSTHGLAVSHAHAVIPRLAASVLQIDAEGRGPGNAMLGYLRDSPLRKNVGEAIEGLSLDGEGTLGISLRIPLGENRGEPTVDGHVAFEGVDIADSKWDITMTDARGEVRFDHEGFIAEDWDVHFQGDPARLSLRSGPHALEPDIHAFEAALGGRFTAEALLARVPELKPLESYFDGRSPFEVEVLIGRARANGVARSQRVRVRSDLSGIALTLPAPLHKSRSSRLPIEVNADLPFARGQLRIDVGDRLHAIAVAGTAVRPFTAHFALGAAASPELPARGIRVSGRADEVDVLGWSKFVSALSRHLESLPTTPPATSEPGTLATNTSEKAGARSAPPSKSPSPNTAPPANVPAPQWTLAQRFAGLDIDADAWLLGGRRFGALTVKGAAASGGLEFTVSGAEAEGRVDVPRDGSGLPLVLEFARLHLPPSKPGPRLDVDPTTLPPLRVAIADFRLGRAELGRIEMQTQPVPQGMHIGRLLARSPRLTLEGEGDWMRDGSGEHSRVMAEIRAPDLGALLTALDFDGVVDGGETEVELDGRWIGAPTDFALAKLEGTMSIAIGAGRLLDLDPGAGRVIGLVNLQAIRRRLSLDFSDFFTPGMAFDRIDGDFRMQGGNATTRNIVLRAPAADVYVSGRTGLGAKDYDQQVEVHPKLGSALPVVGAVAAGPVGAALGWVMQRALEKPLGNAARRRYRVTGPWQKPVIVHLRRRQAPAAPALNPKSAPTPSMLEGSPPEESDQSTSNEPVP